MDLLEAPRRTHQILMKWQQFQPPQQQQQRQRRRRQSCGVRANTRHFDELPLAVMRHALWHRSTPAGLVASIPAGMPTDRQSAGHTCPMNASQRKPIHNLNWSGGWRARAPAKSDERWNNYTRPRYITRSATDRKPRRAGVVLGHPLPARTTIMRRRRRGATVQSGLSYVGAVSGAASRTSRTTHRESRTRRWIYWR